MYLDKSRDWGTNREGVGSWIQLNFDGLYDISSFYYQNRADATKANKKVQLNFSDGSSEQIELNLDITDVMITFRKNIEFVRILVLEVYGEDNINGAQTIYFRGNPSGNIPMSGNSILAPFLLFKGKKNF